MNHQFKKKFGQNFITDKNLLKKIVDSANITNKHVIEIGPGLGSLTVFLAQQAASVTAYEIDTSLKIYLDEIEKNYNSVKIIYEDILKTTFHNENCHVVANIPYNITSPILFKIIEEKNIKSATIMLQKEVADRILAKPKTKQYNALSVILQLSANITKIMNIDKKLFYPVPKVDSTVIKIEKFEETLNNSEINFIKNCFSQKRKTILNNIFSNYDYEKSFIEKFLLENNVNPNYRAEAIEKEILLKLAKAWNNDN